MEIGDELDIRFQTHIRDTKRLQETESNDGSVESISSPSTMKRLTLCGVGHFTPEEQEKLVSALEQIVGPYTVKHHRHTSRSFSRVMELKS